MPYVLQIDMKKMPLGNLSKRQIQSAYSVLTELQTEIAGEKNPSKLLDASNRFYTLVPHDFGLQKPTVLDTDELICAKTKMLDDLLEIEVAYNLLKEGSSEGEKDVLDVHYEQLKADMEVCGYIAMWLIQSGVVKEYQQLVHPVVEDVKSMLCNLCAQFMLYTVK